MPPWVAASSIAVLVAMVPLCWVYRVLEALPKPLVLSHRRWSFWVNLLIILSATIVTARFLWRLYEPPPVPNPVAAGLRLVIAALIYILAFALLIRQYVGLYPEFFVASGRGGVTVRRRLYQNVVRLEERGDSGSDFEVLIYLRSREKLTLSVPSRDLSLLYSLIEKSQPDS